MTHTLLFAAALTAGIHLIAPALHAMPIRYMDIPPTPGFGFTTTLPGYGSVSVSQSPNAIPFTFFHQPQAENGSIPGYSWGTDTDRLNMLNSGAGYASYTVTFTFLNGAPDPTKLLLLVAGLASTSTATVSQPGALAGELYISQINSSTTQLSGQVLSSMADGDPKNTGWALYQPSGSFTTLSVAFRHEPGDGLGISLAYAVPEPSTIAGICLGLAGFGIARRRRARA
ncbi:MAG: PEP-CTERM sorting domain-containing protein [Bryobacterales bacterium]|nr:PEP-CTERM sorting domain-containing protein [Bryobacterales bacterium]